jgi:hypothetical protein
MRRLAQLASTLLPFVALVMVNGAASAEVSGCGSLTAPQVPNAEVTSLTAQERLDYVVPPGPFNPEPIPVSPFCDVSLTLTHPGTNDTVRIAVWLPLDSWNGRFQGTGGGGYAAGLFEYQLAPAVLGGYAAASTDAGVQSDIESPGNLAANPELLTNFASRSLHDMATAGKALTAQFYNRPARYSYWNGCSTGGRQGLMSAQKYPTDYNGIMAAAPAINWTEFLVAEQWPQVVMNEMNTHPSPCKMEAFRQAATTACDRLDKVADGIISAPSTCDYNPYRLVGTKVPCEGQEVTITKADAAVVAKIWAGPGVWSGLPKGTPFYGIANTTPDGTAGLPFPIADNWIKYFVLKDPTYDTSTLTYSDWYRVFAQSIREYAATIDTSNPNLTRFRAAGGKLITWHGEADELIFPAGTTNYWRRVDAATPGKTDDFYRLFMAPGVGHCGGGTGATPVDPLAAVVAWVEQGKAPDVLPAASPTATRNLCPYPLVSRYEGTGNPNDATSYRCARTY